MTAFVLVSAFALTIAQQPLADAVMDGDVKAVQALIAKGADVNEPDNDGITALMRASSAGRADIVRALIAAKANVDARTREGATALTAAAFGGHSDVVEALLAAGADAATKDQQGRTPLMASSLNGHPDVVRALLAKGAQATAVDAAGGGAVTYAAANGHGDVIELLVKAGATVREGDLVLAAEGCHTPAVQTLTKMGVPATAKRNARTALMMAASHGCLDTVKLLLDSGADLQAQDDSGNTAWMYAAAENHLEIIDLFRKVREKKPK